MTERVTHVHHWNDSLFSFRTTRDPGYRFKNGHFTMIGLASEERPLMRAYSFASANYEHELEFFSIKVPDGALTSKLQNLAIGDEILVGKRPTGTLVTDNMISGRYLYLLGTGTGIAPFMSIIKDPEIYDQFDRVILTHGVRYISELAYADYIKNILPNDEHIGEIVREKLVYYPTVTREPYKNNGRITELISSSKLFLDIQQPYPNLEDDRFMICGSPSMIKELANLLKSKDFTEARNIKSGHFVIERAFVES